MQKIFNIAFPVFCLILGMLLYKGCQDGKQSVSRALAAEQNLVKKSAAYDSIDQLKDATLAGWQMDTVQWLAEKTQLLSTYAAANRSVDTAKGILGGQVGSYDAAKVAKDTAAQLAACDSIRNELTKAKGAVTDLQASGETISTAFGYEVSRRDSTINILASDFIKLRSIKDSIAAVGISQTRENIKLTKEAGKHWSVGIGAGVVVGPGGISQGLSVSVHYTIFRI